MTKATYTEISTVLNEFIEVTHKHYGSMAYGAGVLQSQLAAVTADLPKHKQAEVLRIIQAVTDMTALTAKHQETLKD